MELNILNTGKGVMMKALRKWAGGKYYLAKKIINIMPYHTHYLEVFGGAGHIIFNKKLVEINIYNDIDNLLINFWKVVMDEKKKEKMKQLFESFLNSRQMFYETRDNLNNYQDDVYKAIAFLYLNVFSFGGRIRDASWSFDNVKNKNKMNVFLNKKDLLDLYHQKLKHIQIEHCDFRRCFDLYVKKWNKNNLDYLVYLDPPYVLSTRTGKLYNHEFSDNDHKDMIDLILKYNKGKYIVSGYDNDIYKELENNGFKKYCFNVVNRSGENNKKRKTLTECIWVNFDITKGGLL